MCKDSSPERDSQVLPEQVDSRQRCHYNVKPERYPYISLERRTDTAIYIEPKIVTNIMTSTIQPMCDTITTKLNQGIAIGSSEAAIPRDPSVSIPNPPRTWLHPILNRGAVVST